MKPVVSTDWLHQNIQDPAMVILDASQSTYQAGGQSEFENLQIIGSRFFDLKNEFSAPDSKFPNTFPSVEQFNKSSQNLGINSDSIIVVYDNVGIYTSPRTWWMFKVMGHKHVHVLDGGLPAWIADGYPTEAHQSRKFPKGNFSASPDLTAIKSIDEVSQNIEINDFLLIDARSTGRFDGTAPEPRKEISSGHIPNALNLPFGRLLENGKFKSSQELSDLFDSLDLGDQELVFSCGSGVTACIDLLAAELVLDNKKSVYDGSWTEWAQSNRPINKNGL